MGESSGGVSASASIIVGLYAMTTEDGPALDASEDGYDGFGASELISSAGVISSAGANVAGEFALGFGDEGAEENGDLTAPPHCKVRVVVSWRGKEADSLHSLLVS